MPGGSKSVQGGFIMKAGLAVTTSPVVPSIVKLLADWYGFVREAKGLKASLLLSFKATKLGTLEVVEVHDCKCFRG